LLKVACSRDPLGQTLARSNTKSIPPTVIGIVSNAVTQTIRDTDYAAVYVPISRRNVAYASMIVRSRGPSEPMTAPVRAVVRGVDGSLRPPMSLLSDRVEQQRAEPRALASLASTVGMIALVLALVGVYGAATFMVGQRTAEIGVRMAIGASRGQV
jgi:hypothetical protein